MRHNSEVDITFVKSDEIVIGKSIPSNEEYKLQIESSSDEMKLKENKKNGSTTSSS